VSGINLKTLPAIVPGFDYARTLQGNTPAAVAATGFLNTDTLAATISQGQGLASLFSPTVAWSNATLCQFTLSISAAQSTGLSIDDTYYGLVTAARSGVTYPVAAFYLPTLPAPQAQALAAPPDLVALPYAAQLLAQLTLSEAQFEAIPTLVSASSDAIRSWCARRFDQGSVIEEVPVEQDGTIRLARPPINFIQRIQAVPQAALMVSNTSANEAWIYLTTTGDLGGGLTITGLMLNAVAGGVLTSTPVAYGINETINSLASAILAVGSGWTATADSVLGLYPVAEIMDGVASKGATPGDQPDGGAVFHVYSQDVTNGDFHPDDGQRTGIVFVGRLVGSVGPKWGPGWEEMFGSAAGSYQTKVKVTYNGGYASIPREVQLATVELCKAQLNRLGTDLILKSEHAKDYSYEINPDEVKALPTHVLQGLSRYRIINA
jgi:hypothetical protein